MGILRAVGFIGVILVVIGIGQYYLWWRLVRSTTNKGTARRIGTVLAIVLWLMPVVAVGAGRVGLPEWVALPLEYVGFLWLALVLYLALALAVLEIPRFLLNRRTQRHPTSEPETEPEPESEPGRIGELEPKPGADETVSEAPIVDRRMVLARGLAVTAGVLAVGTVGYGVRTATSTAPYRRTTINLARLDPALSGLRIAVLGDLHLGNLNGKDFLARVVDQVNRSEPDLIAICGDLVDGSVAKLADQVGPLAELQSTYGSFFVTGNHEYFTGAQEWIDYLPEVAVSVLHNKRLTLGSGAASIDLAGVDDQTAASSGEKGQGADYAQALDGRDTDRPVILLAHQPIQVDKAAERGVDLQISAHTHGGQLWPFNYVVQAQQGYLSGRYDVGDTQLYVSRGTGFWGPPVRVGAQPEISILTLLAPN